MKSKVQDRHGLVCIDPGLTGTGWAVFYDSNTTADYTKFSPPGRTGCIRAQAAPHCKDSARMGKTYYSVSTRASSIARELAQHIACCECSPTHQWTCILETPTVWGSDPRGFQSNQRGDLIKLSVLIGMIYSTLNKRFPRMEIRLTTPQEWKGQLSKDVTMLRIQSVLGCTFPNHIADAVGMGLSWQNAL